VEHVDERALSLDPFVYFFDIHFFYSFMFSLVEIVPPEADEESPYRVC
jgi:hypothetical protein